MPAMLLLLAAGFGFVPAQPAPTPVAAPPATDIYLVPLSAGLASMKAAKPVAISVARGYDNQPMFSPDGSRLLFAANRDGKQIDIFMFDRASGRVSQLTQTAENENSPTFVPAGIGEAKVVARDIGRSLHRIPGTRHVSFVQRESPAEFWIKQIDIDTRQVVPIVRTAEGSSDRDYAWMPDGQTIVAEPRRP